jgi:hypothetical protein
MVILPCLYRQTLVYENGDHHVSMVLVKTLHCVPYPVLTKLVAISYLMTLSVLRLFNVNDGMINVGGAVGGMRIDKVNRSTLRACPRATFSTINPT